MDIFTIYQWLVGLAVIALAAWLVVRAVRNRKGPRSSRSVGPEGFGGWLLLLALGQTMTPVQTLYDLAQQMDLFEKIVTAPVPYAALKAYIVIGVTLALAGFQALVTVSMFRKQRSFPRLFLYQWVATLAVSVAVLSLPSILMPVPTDGPIAPDDLEQIFGVVIGGGSGVLYVLWSVRVRNTFVR